MFAKFNSFFEDLNSFFYNLKSKIQNDEIDWTVSTFMVVLPLATCIAFPLLLIFIGASWKIFLMALIFAGLTNLSITAGYHRLFSHKSYDAHPIVRFLFLAIGCSAFQGSALKWSSDHRIHHSEVDTDEDPYSIKKGFFYAHMGWLFLKKAVDREIKAPDLEKDKMIKFQHDHYIALAILMGFGLPTLLGYMLGSAVGGFVIGGMLRIVLTQQSTFFVNSLSHTLGKQTYSTEISARDSIIVAILTHGEGYHNFHHKFQIDYRNGIKWYHWDPTKWTIVCLKWLGLAKKLRTISSVEILKARMQMDVLRLRSQGFSTEKLEHIRMRIIEAQGRLKQLRADYDLAKVQMKSDYYRIKSDYAQMKQNFNLSANQKIAALKAEMKVTQIEIQMALRQWKAYSKQV